MKRFILKWVIMPVSFLLRLTLPFRRGWRRVFYTASLMAHVADMDVSVQCDGPVYASGTKRIRIGKRCRIGRDTELRTMGGGQIHIGDDVRISRGCTLVAYSGIYLDSFSIVGEYSSIRDANHGMERGENMRFQQHTSEPIRIGQNVWIGRGCCLLPGITIGEGAVIGANSVVTKDIPADSVAAGSPAKILKKVT
jgi:acetyltransferase-like isoleucine patch superfamily enzyme